MFFLHRASTFVYLYNNLCCYTPCEVFYTVLQIIIITVTSTHSDLWVFGLLELFTTMLCTSWPLHEGHNIKIINHMSIGLSNQTSSSLETEIRPTTFSVHLTALINMFIYNNCNLLVDIIMSMFETISSAFQFFREIYTWWWCGQPSREMT